MMPTNREKIDYIESTVKEKGYNLNTFKIEKVNGHDDVVWNIALAPHRVCEYFRQHEIKIVPIRGQYGLTSLWFDSDPFPTRFYELVDELPEIHVKTKKAFECSGEEAIEYLLGIYPSMVNAVKEHYPEYTNSEVIEFLMKNFNFQEFIITLPEDKYIIEDYVMKE